MAVTRLPATSVIVQNANPASFNANIAPSSQGPEDHETVVSVSEIAKDSLTKAQVPSQQPPEGPKDTTDQEKFHTFFLNQLGESVMTSHLASESSKEQLNQGNQLQRFFLNQVTVEGAVEEIAEMKKASPSMLTQLTLEELNDLLNQGLQFQKFSMFKYHDSSPNKLYVDLLKFSDVSRRNMEKQLFVDTFNKYHGNEVKVFLALIEHLTDLKKLKDKDVDLFTAGDWFLDCAICLLENDELSQVSAELQPYYQNIRTKEQEKTKKISDELFKELSDNTAKFSWVTGGRLSAELGWRTLPEMGNAVSEKCSYFFAATDKFTFIRVQWTRKRNGNPPGYGGTKYFLLGRELYDKLAQKAPKKPGQ